MKAWLSHLKKNGVKRCLMIEMVCLMSKTVSLQLLNSLCVRSWDRLFLRWQVQVQCQSLSEHRIFHRQSRRSSSLDTLCRILSMILHIFMLAMKRNNRKFCSTVYKQFFSKSKLITPFAQQLKHAKLLYGNCGIANKLKTINQ